MERQVDSSSFTSEPRASTKQRQLTLNPGIASPSLAVFPIALASSPPSTPPSQSSSSTLFFGVPTKNLFGYGR